MSDITSPEGKRPKNPGIPSLEQTKRSIELLQLGLNHEYGTFNPGTGKVEVPKDDRLAAKCYREAAELGNPQGFIRYGWCLSNGIGVFQDKQEADAWISKAITNTQNNGFVEYYTQEMVKEFEGLSKLVSTASGQSLNATAVFNLGLCYLSSQLNVPKDRTKAIGLLEQAAAAGHAGAMYSLGVHYTEASKDEPFKGIKHTIDGPTKKAEGPNSMKAFDYIARAAALGNPAAQTKMGTHYYNSHNSPGLDVEKLGKTENGKRAFEYFTKAAEQGDLNALTYLGHCYFQGIGTNKDVNMAGLCYKTAAEGGFAPAMQRLSTLYKSVEWRNMLYGAYAGNNLATEITKSQNEAAIWEFKAKEKQEGLALTDPKEIDVMRTLEEHLRSGRTDKIFNTLDYGRTMLPESSLIQMALTSEIPTTLERKSEPAGGTEAREPSRDNTSTIAGNPEGVTFHPDEVSLARGPQDQSMDEYVATSVTFHSNNSSPNRGDSKGDNDREGKYSSRDNIPTPGRNATSFPGRGVRLSDLDKNKKDPPTTGRAK